MNIVVFLLHKVLKVLKKRYITLHTKLFCSYKKNFYYTQNYGDWVRCLLAALSLTLISLLSGNLIFLV